MFSLNSKLPDVGTSIFAVMSKMAVDYNALNLSQGFPDFNCSEELIGLVNHFMKNGKNQYAPMPGVPELRKQIVKKIEQYHNREYNFDSEITITAGATQALFSIISSVVSNGDEVIVFEPAYDCYVPSIKLNGGIPIHIGLNKVDFSIPWDKVRTAITSKTKCIIINSPHNPTGATIKEQDVKQLEEIVRGKNIFIISDEVYEHIVFDGKEHISLCRSEELYKRSFIVCSFGKTFHTTGWKIGYVCAPERLTSEFRKIHQFVVFAVNTPIQFAYSEFLKNENNYKDLPQFYNKKRDFFKDHMKNSRFKFCDCEGTYFQLLDYSNISEMDDFKFSEYLAKEIGVAVIPLSPFYKYGSTEKLIRICFAKKDDVLVEASKILSKV